MAISWRRVRRMPTFVLRLIAPRPNFAQTLTDSERAIMNSHAAHWRPYLVRGDLVVFGPVLIDEDSYGLAVVESDNEQALREFAAEDPVVKTGTGGVRAGAVGYGSRSRALIAGCSVALARSAPGPQPLRAVRWANRLRRHTHT